MSTLSIPSSPTDAPQRRVPAPVFGAARMRAFARYLAAREGIDHHEFTTPDKLPDVATARIFAEEMRRQLGPLLTEVVCVEQRNNRVMVVLRDGFSHGK